MNERQNFSMSQSEEKMYDLIDKLNELWEVGLHIIPGHYVVVKSKELSKIINGFPDAVSNEIRDAHVILRKKDDILQDARMKADRIIADAENERHRMLNESSIMRDMEEKAKSFREQVIQECEDIKMKAFNEAESVRLNANEESIRIKDGAQNYAQQVLNKLEQNLNQLYQEVMNGQQYLNDLRNASDFTQQHK